MENTETRLVKRRDGNKRYENRKAQHSFTNIEEHYRDRFVLSQEEYDRMVTLQRRMQRNWDLTTLYNVLVYDNVLRALTGKCVL